jgi:hypothetical protein
MVADQAIVMEAVEPIDEHRRREGSGETEGDKKQQCLF